MSSRAQERCLQSENVAMSSKAQEQCSQSEYVTMSSRAQERCLQFQYLAVCCIYFTVCHNMSMKMLDVS